MTVNSILPKPWLTKWVDSEELNEENVDEVLGNVQGILVPGGFGDRGIDGKITAIKYAREHEIPFLGLCLGMQLSIVEYARDIWHWKLWKIASCCETTERRTEICISRRAWALAAV